MKKMTYSGLVFVLFVIIGITAFQATHAEVMLQWFETEWDEMYRRIPEVAEIGYKYIWAPPPTKAPTGLGTKWGNVGYSLYDRFDIGDIPQRGSIQTRYGTRGSLRNMVDNLHQCDVKIIPDIVMNHNGNGPDFRTYPGMKATDFHVWGETGYCNSLDYKRANRMTNWDPDNGYGGTMYEDLCSLIDIRTEDCPLTRTYGTSERFTTPNGPSYVDGTSFIRHIGEADKYPYGYSTTPEDSAGMLYRWIAWLGEAMDYDGLRLDAGKHTPWEFFGDDTDGFLHEAQYNQGLRMGYTNYNDNTTVFENYINRDHSMIFAEILSGWSTIEYWSNHNPMRFLDYQIKQTANNALNGNIGAFYGSGTDFGPANGIMYIWGHDEGPAGKVDLGYAYTFMHIGMPMIYYTGKNIIWDDKGSRTWMIPGYDEYALGDDGNKIANLVWIHNNFAWGKEWNRWADGDLLALERFDDLNDNGNPDSGEGLLLVALNDSGWDKTETLQTSFAPGTVLKDYTGSGGDKTVAGDSRVEITIPGNSGQGWVCYAPATAEITVEIPGTNSMEWIVPGGIHGTDKNTTLPRITSSTVVINASLDTSVGHTLLKWGLGNTQVGSGTHYTNDSALIRANYEEMTGSGTSWSLSVADAANTLPEGLNTIKVRAYSVWPGDGATRFNTATKVVYVDLKGPELVIYPAEGATLMGDAVMVISNTDYTAYGMTVALDGGSADNAHEIMKGLWKFNLSGLSAGGHTAVVTTTEADWGDPRAVINTSIYTRAFNVTANANSISINHSEGVQKELPFFSTTVTAAGSPDLVRLYWDGYELPFNSGGYTNTFTPDIVYRDDSGHCETNKMWGNFVNGQHFFEAIRVDGGVTSRASRRVVFNLYGSNHIDSDSDAIPDNVEMPFIDSDGAPGADAPWPGDSNQNFIPESWETWTRLNPYNHSTFYNGQWDDNNDFDGDGYSNYEEVYAGYVEDSNIYKYDIYDSNSKPSGTPTDPADITYSPDPAQRTNIFTVTYTPNEGPLDTAAAINLHVGHSKRTMGSWQDVVSLPMNWDSGNSRWTVGYTVPVTATSVDFCFNDGDATWDSNNGNDWQANVEGETPDGFVMDGDFDSEGYNILPYNMKIYAAVKGSDLYVATWSTEGSDVFIYVNDELGDAEAPAQGWNKGGVVFFDTETKPMIQAEGDSGWCTWANATGVLTNGVRPSHTALEGSINMVDTFGSIPEAIYIAAAAYATTNDGHLLSQTPYGWDGGNGDIDIMEFQRVPIETIRDEDGNGYFDNGAPVMWTVVNGASNDVNYGLIRFFLDELMNDTEEIVVYITPNPGDTNTVSDVELFSNLNRRDFVVRPDEDDFDAVTTSSATTYYRAYPMSDVGGGTYCTTIEVNRCGAYRINARFKVNGSSTYSYYTDNGLRRDCAVVVSPKKSLNISMYELNPLMAEAQSAEFPGRSTFADMYQANAAFPDAVSTNKLSELGVNMIWLQPIHPIGTEGRQTDPITGSPYEPGSPYAVRNYWQVNSVLGDPSTESNAMVEFVNFVQAYDNEHIGVMLDGTFNHSAWDCEVGQPAVDMFSWATTASDYIRDIMPAWYSKQDYYGDPATYYGSQVLKDIAPAPDRIDFGKWYDVAEFHFGRYDCLVQEAPADTNWAWSSQWYSRYLFEYDYLEDFATNVTEDLWDYFAYYPIYWLEKTGHPVGTPKEDSYKGIDGLRCDFAQGLPSTFWEYCINKTRSVKWDFLFMAESLDGYRTVDGSTHHGVGYRSSRHFDILNENLIYFWRDSFFNVYSGGTPGGGSSDRVTADIKTQFDNRKTAYANVPILLNVSSHDDIFPTYDQSSMLNVYATLSAMGGVPMIFNGQESGAQNDYATYNVDTQIDAKNNWTYYEENFNKSIPNFKRYNCMTSVWAQGVAWMPDLRLAYGRITKARLRSPALRSQNEYFLSKTNGGYDESIFAVAKYESAGVHAGTQDVVFVFVNNNAQIADSGSTNRAATFDVSATVAGGANWFGIQDTHNYNVVDIMSDTPTNRIWGSDKSGASIIADGLYVGLNGVSMDGGQAQFLKLIDTASTYPMDADGNYSGSNYSNEDWDGDGMNNDWEIANALNPNSATGVNGASGDLDGDGMSNYDELVAGTEADNADSVLEVAITLDGSNVDISWASVPDINYHLQYSTSLQSGLVNWQDLYFGTALDTNKVVAEIIGATDSNRFYRATVQP